MCSWCWGFAPELESLKSQFGLSVEVVVGGLRPGPSAQLLDEPMSRYLRTTWDRIAELTGQPFDPAPLAWEGWTYDTELPARAIVSVRSITPKDTLAFFAKVQRSFYTEGIDITDPSVYGDLVAPLGLDAEDFGAQLASEESREEAWGDFRRARAMGVSGFPALFVQTDAGETAVTFGYQPANAIAPLIEQVLEDV
jgi:putative protein-disulfide isomerase